MKKIVIGMLLGAVLMFSGQAVADSLSKVGKRVQGEVVVKVDGVALDVKGLVVDGQTNVPARAFASASGFDIAFENKEVILTKKEDEKLSEQTPSVEEPVTTPEPSQESKYTLESIEELISSQESKISKYEKMLKLQTNDGSNTEQLQNDITKMKDELANLKAIKAELEAKK